MKYNQKIYFNKKGTPTYICHGLIICKNWSVLLGAPLVEKNRESRTGKEKETCESKHALVLLYKKLNVLLLHSILLNTPTIQTRTTVKD